MPDDEIKIYEHETFGKIRIVEREGEPWLLAEDVASVLGYKDVYGMFKSFNERRTQAIGPQYIGLSGLTKSVISVDMFLDASSCDDRPETRRFRFWIMKKVLRKDVYGIALYTWEDVTPCDPEGLLFACPIDEGTVIYGEDLSGESGFPFVVSFSNSECYLEDDYENVYKCHSMEEAKVYAERMVEEIRGRCSEIK